ncbi:MAG: polyhydroxybutyrate depolymerase [Pseudomonadota bacterium]
MRLAGAAAALLLVALAFTWWSTRLLPFPACGLHAGPCSVALGQYSAVLPKGATPPFPAVLYLHGSKGAGSRFIAREDLTRLATGRGFAVLAPDGLDMVYSSGVFSGWSLTHSPGPGRDEESFLNAVLADAEARLEIDRSDVLVMGHSRGGFLVWELACARSGLGTAYAAVSATFWGPPPPRCQPGGAPMLHLHGLRDPGVPIEGRILADGRVMITPAEAAISLVKSAASCAAASAETRTLSGGGTWRGWPACGAGPALVQMQLPGGHAFNRRRFDLALDWFEALPRQ